MATAPGPDSPGLGGRPPRWAGAALVGALLLLLLISPFIGNIAIPPATVASIIAHQISHGALAPDPCAGTGASPALCQAYIEIVWEARLPEIGLALFAGAALGLSGATLQGIFRNPLADPFLLGLSAGGTLGAAVVVVADIGVTHQNLLLPLFAFLGAMGTGTVILLAARSRYGSVETLLLTGVALSSFLSAVLSLLLLSNPTGSEQVNFWLLGSVGSATWEVDAIVFGVLLTAGTLLGLFGRELNLIQLGNDVAQSLGVDTQRVRVRLLLLTSITTAVAVAFTGIIGFVGLVAPHVIRRAIASDYRIVLPGAALAGGGFLLVARDLSLLALPASVLPLGIFTSFAGAPFFAYLLYRRRDATMGGS